MPKQNQRLIGSILLFVMVQIAWFGLLAIWIYWYIANYITFTQISERVYLQIDFNTQNVVALVGGIVLLASISGGISVLFGKLRRQLKVTKMYESFIANVTHELKSPLASMQIHLETLISRSPSKEESRVFLNLMRKDAGRLDKHISSILQIAGLEERGSILQRAEQNVDTLFRGLFARSSEQCGIPLENVQIEGSANCAVEVDERAMEIVIDNLVDNAAKYSEGVPKVTMMLSRTKKSASVTIRDEGIGISQTDQKNVFGKFVRIENPASPSVKGTGLGLYWVREIIRHHDGHISVASDGLGYGSSFTFELPVFDEKRSRTGKNKNKHAEAQSGVYE